MCTPIRSVQGVIETRVPSLASATSVPLAEAAVDLSAVARNLSLVARVAGAPVMAVVKADAFGLGAVEVAGAALEAGATWLGVATIDEALELKRAGITAPVLAWLTDEHAAIDEAVSAGVTVSCSDVRTLDAVADAAWRRGQKAEVHLEVDTGMNRGGASRSQWRTLFRAAASPELRRFVEVGGLWSHLAGASNSDRAGVAGQHAAFTDAVRIAASMGLRPRLLHLANSAGALAHPECCFSLVRVGAALYGIETLDGITVGLESPIRFTSRVLHVRRADADSAVGYGGGYRTAASTTLALVPVGYADGVPRSLSGVGSVSIGGRRHPIAGSISMDQLVVDVGDRDIRPGDEVVLLGSADAGEPDPREWSVLTGTVPHEILTGIGARVRRRYVRS